ncbi:MAG: hypothetical protein KF768_08995 [Phycisphaeraceae bacterium]|nr:hypothetical protein [Phycisphaeraceae bacterium]
MTPSRTLLALCPMLALILAGCLNDGARSHSDVDRTDRPVYPDELRQEMVLDVQVIRDGTRIRLTNTTAKEFGASRLWVNRWFSREIDGFGVGQTLDLSLAEFRDRYGEPFRAGGFFATRRPDRLAQVQIESDGRLLGLVAIPEKER